MSASHIKTDTTVRQSAPSAGRSVLIVSPYFPPSALAGIHRARHLVRHLPAQGWQPRLVCVDERHYEQEPDPILATLVPENAQVEKVGAIPLAWTRPFGLGEIGIRAFAPLRSHVLGMVSRHRIPVVLITGSPFYPMLLARSIRALGAVVVLDFQDPWVSDWGAAQPRFSKAGMSHALATLLEPRAVRAASFITSVSSRQNTEMLQRYPELGEDRFAAIPIGGDPEDFARLRRSGAVSTDGLLAPDKMNLSFVGTFMPRSGPLMSGFLQGVKRLRAEVPDLASRVRFNFIGTGNHSAATQRPVTEIARALGVDDLVFELAPRIAYSRAIAALAKSDAVVLVGSDEPHYTASKIYPGLMCGRPFVSLFHTASSSHAILRAAGGAAAIGYDPTEGAEASAKGVADALSRVIFDPSSVAPLDARVYADFEATAIAARYAKIFEALS